MLTGHRFSVFRVPAQFNRFKPGGADRPAQLRLGDDRRHIFDARFFGRKRDRCFEHAIQPGQGFFEPGGIVGVGQALDD